MRILHVIQSMSEKFGGPSTVVSGLAKTQVQAGLEVEVATTNIDTPMGGILDVPTDRPVEWNGVKIHYFPVQNNALLFSRQLRQYVREKCTQFDIIHIHGLYRFPPTYAAYIARKQNVPYIIMPHGSLDPYLHVRSTRGSVMLKRLYERVFDLPNLTAASAIHFTTEEERERSAHIGLRAPSFVIPIGLDWGHFEHLPERGGFRARLGLGEEPLVLFLGRLHFVKGLDLLVPAFAQVRERFPDAVMAIVGPDNDGYGTKVKSWVRDRGLDSSACFVDALHGADVVQAYVDADVFVLSSYTENFGMTVVEAMACELPVVISDQVNIHHEVAASGGGLVTRCDVKEIADAILELLGDADRRKAMGQAGRSAVQATYTWPVIVDLLASEYNRVIARSRQK